jgi:hypothetical protein
MRPQNVEQRGVHVNIGRVFEVHASVLRQSNETDTRQAVNARPFVISCRQGSLAVLSLRSGALGVRWLLFGLGKKLGNQRSRWPKEPKKSAGDVSCWGSPTAPSL